MQKNLSEKVDKVNLKRTLNLPVTENDILHLKMAIEDFDKSPNFAYLKKHRTSQIISILRLFESAKNLLTQIEKDQNSEISHTRKHSEDLKDFNTSTSQSKRKASIKKFYSRLKSNSKSRFLIWVKKVSGTSQSKQLRVKSKPNILKESQRYAKVNLASIGSDLIDNNDNFFQNNLRTTFGKIPDSKLSKGKRITAKFQPSDFPPYFYPSALQKDSSQFKDKFMTQNSVFSGSFPSQSNLYSKNTGSIPQKYLQSQTTTTNFEAQKLDLSGIGLLSRQELMNVSHHSRNPSKMSSRNQVKTIRNPDRPSQSPRLGQNFSKSVKSKKSSKKSFIFSQGDQAQKIRSKTLKNIRLFTKSGRRSFVEINYSKINRVNF